MMIVRRKLFLPLVTVRRKLFLPLVTVRRNIKSKKATRRFQELESHFPELLAYDIFYRNQQKYFITPILGVLNTCCFFTLVGSLIDTIREFMAIFPWNLKTSTS
jgi:hypothetical protein